MLNIPDYKALATCKCMCELPINCWKCIAGKVLLNFHKVYIVDTGL